LSKPISGYYDATKYLGQFIGEKEEFLRETACMSPEMRVTFAVLEGARDFFKDEPELIKMIDELKPILKKIGFAQWQRDTVTDMALKKANPQETEDFPDDSDQDEKSP
jgi:hypothetical protein